MTTKTSPLALVAGLVLAAISIGSAVRAGGLDPATLRRTGHGLYSEARAGEVRAMMARFAEGLLACQETGGWFRREVAAGSTFATNEERVAASMLAASALAVVHRAGDAMPGVEGLDEGLSRALRYLRSQQEPAGPIGRAPPGDPWPQVEATAAGLWALSLLDLPEQEDRLARKDAGGALLRLRRDGLRNGYTRALVAMVAERLATLDLEVLIGGSARDLVNPRQPETMPTNEGYELWETTLAEVIARTVLGLKRGLDPLPGRVLTSLLEKPPAWEADVSDSRTWWMQGWIVARSGKGAAWFAALADAYERWSQEQPPTVPSSFYSATLLQTAAAVLALDEGLRAE